MGNSSLKADDGERADRQPSDRVPLLDLPKLHRPIEPDLNQAMESVLTDGRYILGPNVKALEEEIAAYSGAAYAVGVASGSDALYLCLRAHDVGPGDEVITAAFSYIASADSISLTGASPVFVDVDPDTFNIDPTRIEQAITSRTRAIVPVHLFGQPADMESINDIAFNHGLAVIEDNAQSIGASYKGLKTGTLGHAAALSFFPSKNLGCLGDGGMVISSDQEFIERVRRLRAHGSSRKYHSTELGLNSRLDELQAAVLRIKLPLLDSWNDCRRNNARLYDKLLEDIPGLKTPALSGDSDHVYHQYTIRAGNREALQEALTSSGIGWAVYYPEPLHLQPLFSDLGLREGAMPVAEQVCKEVLSLPVGPELSEPQVRHVSGTVAEVSAK